MALPLREAGIKFDGDTAHISARAQVSPTARLGRFVIIHERVTIGPDVLIGDGVTIYPGVKIGAKCEVLDHAVIGKMPRSAKGSTLGAQRIRRDTVIAEKVVVGTSAVIYAGCFIGTEAFIGDGASLRENCDIGNETTIGRGVALETGVRVGHRCLVFTAAYLSEYTIVEDEVFIGARVCTASGKIINYRRHIPTEAVGPLIRRGARIGTGAVLHPGIEIGPEAVVALGAVVFENVPAATMVLGNPARAVKKVSPSEFLPESDEKEAQ